MKLILKNTRLSFANLYTATSKFEGTEPKFSACFIIDPETKEGKANLEAFGEIVSQLEKDYFKGKQLANDKKPIKDGNTKDYDGWKDMKIISASNKRRPRVIGCQKQPVAEGDDQAPESGNYVNAALDVWAMDGKFGQRICASLEAVQYASKGEPFTASTVDIESDFDEIDADEAFGL